MRLSILLALLVHTLAAQPVIQDVRRIWDRAPHNAFTDLVRFNNAWLCTFREGQGHVSPDGKLRVIRSADGEIWESAALISDPRGDLRDPKLVQAPEGKLMLLAAVAMRDNGKVKHQSVVWFSDDGSKWSEPKDVGDENVWLWRVTWSGDTCLGIGYATDKSQFVRLYQSSNGTQFKPLVPRLYSNDDSKGEPNESSIIFQSDRSAVCLLRRDGSPAHGLLGFSTPPYNHWTWKDIGLKIGGPHLIQLPDKRLIGGVRLYDGRVRTSLVELNPETGAARERVSFPSSGDSSYPGLAWHQDTLWVTYYSSHEGKTAIYLARVKL